MPGQRRLSGARRADDAERLAGLEPKRTLRRTACRAARRHVVDALDRQAALSASAVTRLVARRAGEQQVADRGKAPSAPRRGRARPDGLFDRLQRAAEQDAGRKHRAGCRHAVDHQIGADARG